MRYLLALLFLFPALVHAQSNWLPGEVLVYLTADADAQQVAQDVKAALPVGAVLQRMEPLGKGSRYHVLRFGGSDLPPVPALERLVKQLDGVQMTSLNYRIKTLAQPNDPLYGDQWNMGSINVEPVWDVTTGGSMSSGQRIAVGIMDELVQTNHPDLSGNIGALSPYQGSGEDHGTEVAGVIGAVGDNGIGIAGVNWDVDLLSLGGFGSLGGSIEGFEAAINLREAFNGSSGTQGAMVVAVTASWTVPGITCGFGEPLFADMAAAGILVVTAGDNGLIDLDVDQEYPSSCLNSNNIVVTTIGEANEMPFAFGDNTVHLFAPGLAIPTTELGGGFATVDGNSFAVPHVAGAIALLYANDCPNFAALVLADPVAASMQVKQALLNSVTAVPGGAAKTITGGKLNVGAAFNALVAGCSTTCEEITITLTATGGATPNFYVIDESATVVTGGSGPSFTTCLPLGCYTMFVSDDQGAGLAGTYTVEDDQGAVLGTGSYDGSFGIPMAGLVFGCIDPTAANFDPNATCDDGSCCPVFTTLTMLDSGGDGWEGATYTVTNWTGAVVYSGTLEDGSSAAVDLCTPEGCYEIVVTDGGDPSEISWTLSGAATASGVAGESQSFTIGIPVSGCTDPTASNFNSNATCDDGSCAAVCYPTTMVVQPADFSSTGSVHAVVTLSGVVLFDADVPVEFNDTYGVVVGALDICPTAGCLSIQFQEMDVALAETGFIFFDNDLNTLAEFPVADGLDFPIGPQPAEICDGLDNDCDGEVDEGFTWYTDADGDGFGDDATAVLNCTAPPNTINVGGDCDDTNPDVHPGAAEVCDGSDNNCDGITDVQLTGCTDPLACNYDPNAICDDGSCAQGSTTIGNEVYSPNWTALDSEGNTVELYALLAQGKTVVLDLFAAWCAPSIQMLQNNFLQDWNAHMGPDGTDHIRMVQVALDQDIVDPAPFIAAADWPVIINDVEAFTTLYGDLGLYNNAVPTVIMICPDRTARMLYGGPDLLPYQGVFNYDPDAGLEILNTVCGCRGEPCVANIGCMDPSACNYDPTATCPSGLCLVETTWYEDADNDGFGDDATATVHCTPPLGLVQQGGDCDDTDPGSTAIGEPCDDGDPLTHSDSIDGNCTCVGLPLGTCPPGEIPDCNGNCAPANWVGDGICDNGTFEHNSNFIDFNCAAFNNDGGDCAGCTTEVCDGIDNDCDGLFDEDFLWYADVDGDGFGDPATGQVSCVPIPGMVDVAGDCDDNDANSTVLGQACDDGDPDTFVDVIDVACNCAGTPSGSCPPGQIPDCNGNCAPIDWVGDGTCDNGSFSFNGNLIDFACAAYGNDGGDCDNPCTPEICDGLDNDCDGEVDENFIWYADQDGDGWGDPATAQVHCTPPFGSFVVVPFDCDDEDPDGTVIGVACDDGDPLTHSDMIDENCTCTGLPMGTCPPGEIADCNGNCAPEQWLGDGTCDDGSFDHNGIAIFFNCPEFGNDGGDCGSCDNDLNLVFQTDGVTNVGWEIRQQGTDALIQSGGGVYPESLGYGVSTCVPNGCYYLVVTSDLGGIVQNSVEGGYILSTLSGDRLIDNRNNFLSGTTSQIAGGEGFCFPMATTPRIIYTSCDKMDWNVGPCDGSAPSQYKSEFIVADINAAVSASYPNAQSGFTFWFYNPNGNYNFRRFRSHAQGEGAPVAAADRYTHCLLNNWAAANALQQNTLYNVRVRAVVNNIPGEFGPACRMMLDQTAAQCPATKLMDVPGHPQLSCGQNRDWGNGNYVYARPVWRYNNNCVKVNANRYRFRFFQTPEESYDVTVTSGNYARQLNWGIGAGAPLDAGETYKVTVEASFDNGASYCPAGDVCLLTMSIPPPAQGGGNQNYLAAGQSERSVGLYPNPNRGDQLYLALAAVEEGVHTVSVDIYDLFGKRVSARTVAVNDGFINTVLELNGELASGMYMVNITAGDAVYTRRLVIQP